MLVILDYKIGNVGSLVNMLKKIGVSSIVSSDPKEIEAADKIIFPGVGAFDNGMNNLLNSGLIPLLEKKVKDQSIPILGVCLGMQLFAGGSEEGKEKGLGWIEGEVVKFKFQDSNFKIPHMGWNTIDIKKTDPVFNEMPKETRFYFVHSYHFVCDDKKNVLATTNYGYDFESIIRKDNIWGVQFHPEKSHKFGMQLLKNFVEIC